MNKGKENTVNLKGLDEAWDIYIRLKDKGSRLIDMDEELLLLNENYTGNPFDKWNNKRVYRNDFEIILVDPDFKQIKIGSLKTTYMPRSLILSMKDFLIDNTDIKNCSNLFDDLELEESLFSKTYYDNHEVKKLLYYLFCNEDFISKDYYENIIYINCIKIQKKYRHNGIAKIVFILLEEFYRDSLNLKPTIYMLNASPLKSEYYPAVKKSGQKMSFDEIEIVEDGLSEFYKKLGFSNWGNKKSYNYMFKILI